MHTIISIILSLLMTISPVQNKSELNPCPESTQRSELNQFMRESATLEYDTTGAKEKIQEYIKKEFKIINYNAGVMGDSFRDESKEIYLVYSLPRYLPEILYKSSTKGYTTAITTDMLKTGVLLSDLDKDGASDWDVYAVCKEKDGSTKTANISFGFRNGEWMYLGSGPFLNWMNWMLATDIDNLCKIFEEHGIATAEYFAFIGFHPRYFTVAYLESDGEQYFIPIMAINTEKPVLNEEWYGLSYWQVHTVDEVIEAFESFDEEMSNQNAWSNGGL